MQSPNHDRDARIIAAARLGQSHEAIAREHRISRPRVTQIVNAANPRSPEETQRHLIATRLRQKWDELQRIVDRPPIKSTSIGRVMWDPRSCTCGVHGDTKRDHAPDCEVEPVLAMNDVVGAIKAQLAVEQQFRAMFGTDLAARPGPVLDDHERIKWAEIQLAHRQLSAQAPALPPPALPANYHSLPPDQQAQADLDRRRAAFPGGIIIPPAVAAGGAAAIHAWLSNRQYHAQLAATPPADDDIPEAEIVD